MPVPECYPPLLPSPWWEAFTPTSTPTLTPTSTATPTRTPTPSLPGEIEKIFDDNDPAFSFTPGWTSLEELSAYAGSYSLASKNGLSSTLVVTGHSFSLIYKMGPGYGLMDVHVDGVKAATIDQYATATTSQIRWDFPDVLPEATYTLTFVLAGEGSNTTGSVDAAIVRSFPTSQMSDAQTPLPTPKPIAQLSSAHPVHHSRAEPSWLLLGIQILVRDLVILLRDLIAFLQGAASYLSSR